MRQSKEKESIFIAVALLIIVVMITVILAISFPRKGDGHYIYTTFNGKVGRAEYCHVTFGGAICRLSGNARIQVESYRREKQE